MRIDPTTKKIIKTEIRLGRTSGGDDLFYIEIVDSASGLIILDAKMDSEQIGNLISNRIAYSKSTDFYANPNIGLKHEADEVSVSIKIKSSTPKIMAEIFDTAEKQNPGWIADRESFNRHRYRNGEYFVTIRRWVDGGTNG